MAVKTIAEVLRNLRRRYVRSSDKMRLLEHDEHKEKEFEQTKRRRWQLLKEISRIENGGVP